jgi:hypothetical protein
VKIEPFNTSTNSFGTGLARRSIPFPQFLDILQDESQKGKWYLTTQYDEEQDNGDGENEEPPRDPICPPPTDKLVLDFSQRPRLMGNLVLQQSNIWYDDVLIVTSIILFTMNRVGLETRLMAHLQGFSKLSIISVRLMLTLTQSRLSR